MCFIQKVCGSLSALDVAPFENMLTMFRKYINDNYGSKRGLLEAGKHRILYRLGKYDKYKAVDWDKVERLVFVCKGNICRSAFAEVVAKKLNIEAISCGIDTDDGKPANEKAIRAAARTGYRLDEHRTRKITSIEFKKGDLLVAMEPYQAEFIQGMHGNQDTATLLGLWGTPVSPYVHDPYSTGEEYFAHCFDYIEKTVSTIGARIR